MDKELLQSTVSKVLDEMRQRLFRWASQTVISTCPHRIMSGCFPAIPSARKALLQPGQYAAEQTVTLVGPKGQLKMCACSARCAR